MDGCVTGTLCATRSPGRLRLFPLLRFWKILRFNGFNLQMRNDVILQRRTVSTDVRGLGLMLLKKHTTELYNVPWRLLLSYQQQLPRRDRMSGE
jgi:hypothetical protein